MNRYEESVRFAKNCEDEAARLGKEAEEQMGLAVGYHQRAVALRDCLTALGADIDQIKSGQQIIMDGAGAPLY